MAIARSRKALIGTDDSNGVSINNNASAWTAGGTDATSDVDLLGDDISVGDVWLYVVFTSSSAGGTLDITFSPHRIQGIGYIKDNPDVQVPIINGTKKVPLGKRPCDRYMSVKAFNNASSVTLTNVSILAVVEKWS